MDAAQLVEQRKAGKITQQEFFIALNRLRKANCSSIGVKSVSREATRNKCQLVDGTPQRSAKETNPESGGDRAYQTLDDGQRVCVTALSYVNKVSPLRCRNDEKMKQFIAGSDDSAHLKTFHDLNEGRASGNFAEPFSTPETVHHQRRPLPPSDSKWRFSPLGETEIYCQRRSRKTPESRGAYHGSSKVMPTRTLYGDSAAPSEVQSPQRTKARLVDNWTPQPPWRPTGGCTPMLYEEVMGPHCYRPSAMRNNVDVEMAPQRVKGEGEGEGDIHAARFDGDNDRHRRHKGNGCPRSESRERSPVTISRSWDETKRGMMTEVGRGMSVNIKDASPILDISSMNSGPRHQESNEQTSFNTYENSSRRESLRYYTKARVDRYGYPLHKNEEDLVSTGVEGDRAGLLFAPMIKGLPEFYRGRSSKKGSSRFATEECYSGQPVPLYERAMDWKAKADELRARRMMKREEMEIANCTFHPNILRRSTPCDRPGEGAKGKVNRPDKGREGRVAVVASERLFEASKRLQDRRSEEQEGKKMWEEESFARSCTFQPSLMGAAGPRSRRARARYMDPPTKPAGPVAKTFHPKIIGVKPDMVRAIEYVSVDVVKRLHRDRTINSQPTKLFSPSPEGFMKSKGGRAVPEVDQKYRCPCRRYGDAEGAVTSSQPDMYCRRGGSYHDSRGEVDFRTSRDDQRQSQEGRGVTCSSCGWQIADQENSRGFIKAERHYRRPHSAPASTTGRAGFCCPWGGVDQSAIGECVPEGMGKCKRRRGKETIRVRRERNDMEAASMAHRDGRESSNRPSGRQAAISFQEFLVRQAHSQAAAGKRLNRLKSMHTPTFTPQLSRGTRRLAARNGPSAGGGTFKERLDLTKRRRSLSHKAAVSKATAKQKELCTFSPRLTSRSSLARSRSARERSIGDSVLKAAKERMARAREDIKLLDGPGADNSTFKPILATAGHALAPRAPSRLRLAAELDTYMERVQFAAMQRDEERFKQQQRAKEEEDRECTFRPEITECPELVRHTAAGMRRIREFHKKEALRLNQGPVPKPDWR